jgi:flagellar L-ring protein precursor FlgH
MRKSDLSCMSGIGIFRKGINMFRIFFFFLIIALTGCAHQHQEALMQQPENIIESPAADYSSGSLWQESSNSITGDFKARKKGDTLTIVISEQASASKEASTSTKRSTGVSAGIPNFLGLETTFIKNWMDLSKLLNASTGTQYEGDGSTTRKENLNATITARVVDVMANGNLRIAGRRNVKVNNEDMIILLEGIVRPKDISAENIVNSSYVADARITYSGKGVVSDRQSPGWLMNIIDKVWPF